MFNDPTLATALIIGVIFLIGVFGFTNLGKDAAAVHGKLRDLRKAAEDAKTKEDLMKVRAELLVFHRERCWHHKYGDHAREVLAFIDGRLSAF